MPLCLYLCHVKFAFQFSLATFAFIFCFTACAFELPLVYFHLGVGTLIALLMGHGHLAPHIFSVISAFWARVTACFNVFTFSTHFIIKRCCIVICSDMNSEINLSITLQYAHGSAPQLVHIQSKTYQTYNSQ